MIVRGAQLAILMGLIALGASGGAKDVAESKVMPAFEVDTSWPRLPNNWVFGQTPSVAVDRHDHVWILHRPRTVAEANRDKAAPPVLEFDAAGSSRRGEDLARGTTGPTANMEFLSITRTTSRLA
jgi:hypothetical protein